MEFEKFGKIARLSRDIVITEKIDGTNAQVYIVQINDIKFDNRLCTGEVDEFFDNYCLYQKKGICMFAGSRKRWLDTTSKGDNYGFAKWVKANAEELLKLGEGRHFGEWYGKGIQRNYGLDEKRFSLFNVRRWHDKRLEARLISVNPKTKEEKWTTEAPHCCEVVPILYQGPWMDEGWVYAPQKFIEELNLFGSKVSPGFMKPEGIVLFHLASGQLFKKTIENDEKPKTLLT